MKADFGGRRKGGGGEGGVKIVLQLNLFSLLLYK